jgi:AraC family transcriptional regulator of adaptative response/methylated-DNA-[protein]-cysteine methyltransferase
MRYTVVESPLGLLLLAAGDAGIAWLGLGDSEPVLRRELRSDFPDARLNRDDAALRPGAESIVAFLKGKAPCPALALDLRGTPFQRKVWDELRAIPAGATRSYGEIATRIGNPRAARAVGAAVGANPVSLLVPCHRAVRTGGALGGYRWGIERKRRLLELEKARPFPGA